MSPHTIFSTNSKPGPAPNGQGNGLFASQPIKPGDVILHIQSPFVAVLDTQRLTDTCSGCFGKRQVENEAEVRACTGCQVVRYCDRTCQSTDWKAGHSFECAIFKKLSPRVLPNNARALLRMVQRWSRGKYTPLEVTLFRDLETHVDDIKAGNTSQWERITLSSTAVKAYSKCGIDEEGVSAFGAKLDINSFNLTTALGDRIGLYLHPYAALMNHSCAYNAVVGFDGPSLYVHALRPIQPGEQICISYVDATNPRYIRQRELRERYFFDCGCSRCTQRLESESKSDEDADAHGNGDGDRDEDEDESTWTPPFKEAVEKAYTLMELVTAPGGDVNPDETVTTLESAVQTIRAVSSSWPMTKQPLVSLRDELIAALLSAGRFRAAFVHAAVRVARVDPVVYPSSGHPVRMLHVWTLARLGMYLSAGEEQEQDQDQGGSEEKEEREKMLVEKYRVKYSLLIWGLLRGIVEGTGKCAVPGFMGMVRAAFGEVHREFLAVGCDPRGIQDEVKREWEKVEELVNEAIEKGF